MEIHLKLIAKGEMTMKKIAVVIIVVIVSAVTSSCFAESGIPNLVGAWIVQVEGGVFTKGGTIGPKTHFKSEFSSVTGEAVVTKQKGRVLHGTFTATNTTEAFIAVIGMDNKGFFYADEDGFDDGIIVNKDKINIVYRQITPTDTVAGVGTWTRKK